MKRLLTLLILITTVCKAQTPVSTTPTIIYTSSGNITLRVSIEGDLNHPELYLIAHDSVCINNLSSMFVFGVGFVDVPLKAGDDVICYAPAGSHTYTLSLPNGAPFVFSGDNQTPAIVDSIEKRRERIDLTMGLIWKWATPAQFDTVAALLATPILMYPYKNNDILKWVRGLAPYVLNGFPTKSYFTVARRTRLLDILQ